MFLQNDYLRKCQMPLSTPTYLFSLYPLFQEIVSLFACGKIVKRPHSQTKLLISTCQNFIQLINEGASRKMRASF